MAPVTAAIVGRLQEVVRDLDLLRLLDREPRRRRPVVLLGPLGLAAQGVRLELRVEDRHDRVHAEHVVRGGGQAGHHLGVEVGLGERRVDEVHHLDRHDRAQRAGRDLVHVAPVDRRQEPPARRHPFAREAGVVTSASIAYPPGASAALGHRSERLDALGGAAAGAPIGGVEDLDRPGAELRRRVVVERAAGAGGDERVDRAGAVVQAGVRPRAGRARRRRASDSATACSRAGRGGTCPLEPTTRTSTAWRLFAPPRWLEAPLIVPIAPFV